MSPTARSSLESSFYKRTRTTTPTSAPIDPVTQAQTVQALRQQFNEKQAAKDLKFQQAEARTREKEAKRQARRDEDERRKSEGKDRKRSKSLGASEKVGHFSRDHLSPQLGVTEIRTVEDAGVEERVPRRRRTETAGSASKAVRSQWMLFWFRFKTMWLKVKRKMSLSSSSH
ncbi:hypothetical protein MMC12_008155 [Toensbergia leucococca]|nr:hypothetical protein [Toensbergia leucococca]